MLPTTYDYSELKAPFAYSAAKKEAPAVNKRWLLIVLVLFVFTAVVLFGFAKSWRAGDENPTFLGVAALMLIGIAVCYAVNRRQVIKAARLKRFAKKNGLELIVNEQPVERDSILYGPGDQRAVLFGLRDKTRGIETGQYRYITGFNYSARIWQYTYVSMHSSKELPSVYIHSRKNDARARSTNDIARSVKDTPVLSYGMAFDEKFEVHNLDTSKNVELPETLKNWLTQQGGDFDYILWDKNIIMFRRGFIRFTQANHLSQFMDFIDSLYSAAQGNTDASSKVMVAPQPAINSGQVRRTILTVGLLTLLGLVLLMAVQFAISIINTRELLNS